MVLGEERSLAISLASLVRGARSSFSWDSEVAMIFVLVWERNRGACSKRGRVFGIARWNVGCFGKNHVQSHLF